MIIYSLSAYTIMILIIFSDSAKFSAINLSAFACLIISAFLINKNNLTKNSIIIEREVWNQFKTELKKAKPIPRFFATLFFALGHGLLFYSLLHLNYN